MWIQTVRKSFDYKKKEKNMKSYYKFTMLGRENIVLAGNMSALVRLEVGTKLHFEPTGLNDDDFGRGFIEKFSSSNGNNVWTFPDLKKYVNWRKSIGENL